MNLRERVADSRSTGITFAAVCASYREMASSTRIRTLAICLTCVPICGLICGGVLCLAQTALPPTSPTSAVVATAVPASVLTPAERATHRAEVSYTGGQLQVMASNSSLNQILRDISRRTGLTITGGVKEERVYGKYGPAATADVLASLLDGASCNMLYIAGDGTKSAKLVLTPRDGGPTPPEPSATANEDEPIAPAPVPAVVVPAQASSNSSPSPQNPPQNVPNVTGGAVPLPPLHTGDPSGFVSAPTSTFSTEPGTTPGPMTQQTGTSSPQPTDPSTPPAAVKTPQQIFELLQQLQQQKQQPPANPQ